jgi:hypothetical protein
MRKEIRKWVVKCDWCGVEYTEESLHEPGLPETWGIIHVRNCGMTDYTRDYEVCGACLTEKGYKNGQSI